MRKTTLCLVLVLATTIAWAGDKTKEVIAKWKASEKARLAYIKTLQ